MGRRLADGARACAGRPARLLHELRADRISDRAGAGDAGVHAGQQIARGRFRGLWLAHSVPDQHRPAGDRDVRAIAGAGNAGVRGSQEARRPVRQSRCRSRRQEHRDVFHCGRIETVRSVLGLHAHGVRRGLCHHQARSAETADARCGAVCGVAGTDQPAAVRLARRQDRPPAALYSGRRCSRSCSHSRCSGCWKARARY